MDGQHRLPGMSIPATDWQALTEIASETGTTRTELIREFIHRGVTGTAGVEEFLELLRTQYELQQAQEQLELVRRELRTIAHAAEKAAGLVASPSVGRDPVAA